MSGNCLPREFESRINEILPSMPAGIFEPKLYQSFRINTLKTTVKEALSSLLGILADFQMVSWCPYAVIVPKNRARELLDSNLVREGIFYAQGLESMLAVMALDPLPGQRVLDLCAAPGSKSTQIAMHMQNTGTLVANEPIRNRFFKLKSVVELLGAQLKLISVDGRRLQMREGRFDRILVDVPCSCEGRFILGEAKSFGFWSLRKIKEMSHKQKGLILNASRLLGPGGVLVYSTCTYAPEENEEVVDWFLRKTEGQFKLTQAHVPGLNTYPCLEQWQGRTYDSQLKLAARIMPDERMEGFFIAKFVNSYYK
ncbi:MAG: RsmB/NOP family class I SAM-dependent RNA methyltransferase [Candidatus Omnitrophica bacterium]|nr:RsmB/NOP family class I SAM-dependent RNA methyltransferase [Candidatus Omnitrophota bacterium]